MNNTLTIFLGALLGMLLLIAVLSVYVQQSSKYALGFGDAFLVYTTKNVGPIIVGFIVILMAMFVFPEVAAQTFEGKYAAILNNITTFLRAWSILLGLTAQGIGFLLVRTSGKYLRAAEEKLQIKKQLSQVDDVTKN